MRGVNRRPGLAVGVLVLLTLAAAVGAACGGAGATAGVEQPSASASEGPECPVTGQPAGDNGVWVVVFFPDRQGWYAVPEFRVVPAGQDEGVEALAKAVFAELERGPSEATLLRILPEGTRLLGVRPGDGTLYLDLSQDFVEKQPGGSLWELLVLRSLTNSMLELPGVERVQLLVEGEKAESLAGHLAVDVPLERDPVETGAARMNYDREEVLQERVDGGQESWRRSPEETVCREGRIFGFSGRTKYELVYFDRGQADVRTPLVIFRAKRDGIEYLLSLVQPIKTGPEGTWTIIDVRAQP